jgi:hypothetical protein
MMYIHENILYMLICSKLFLLSEYVVMLKELEQKLDKVLILTKH